MSARSRAGKTGRVVAVEIGNDWLKILQAEPGKRGLSVGALHLEKLDGTAGASHAVEAAFKRLNLPRDRVIACLPRQTVNVRMLDLPSTDRAEIADMVELQSGRQTPYSREEIVSDYKIVGSPREGYTRVMLAIVQRGVLRERFFILEEAGLGVERMCVSTEGVFNWIVASRPAKETVLAIDVDSFYTDVLVVSGGAVMFTRSVLHGANDLLAEPDRRGRGFAREILQSLEIAKGELPGLVPDRVVLCGAGPRVEGLAEAVGEQLGMAVESGDAMRSAAKPPAEPSLSDPPYRAVSLTALIGAALDPAGLKLNLVPDSVRMRKRLVEKARSLTALAVLVMTVMVAASFWATLGFFFKQSRLNAVRRDVARAEPRADNVMRMREIVKRVNRDRDTRSSAIRLLAEIHALVPAGILFDAVSLNVAGDEIVLGGSGVAPKDIRELVNNLEESPLLERAREQGRTTLDPETGRWRFQVSCVIGRTP